MFSTPLIWLAAKFGFGLTQFWASAIVWAVVIVGALAWYDNAVDKAEERGRLACEAEVKRATDKERERVDKANEEVQVKDAEIRRIQRGMEDEIDKRVKASIVQTKTNSNRCWDRNTIDNINRVR
jgi:uncharacterized membrane protein YhiD involved in acid resistance